MSERLFTRFIATLMAVILLGSTSFPAEAVDTFSVGKHVYVPESMLETGVFVVVDHTPVRNRPYKEGAVVDYLERGTYIIDGDEIKNDRGSSWIVYYDEDGDECFIYTHHVEKHIHNFVAVCKSEYGELAFCDCGELYIDDDEGPFTINCKSVVCQVLAGNWSNTNSVASILINQAIAYKGEVIPYVGIILKAAAGVRDIAADVYYASYCLSHEDSLYCYDESFSLVMDIATQYRGAFSNNELDAFASLMGSLSSYTAEKRTEERNTGQYNASPSNFEEYYESCPYIKPFH